MNVRMEVKREEEKGAGEQDWGKGGWVAVNRKGG